MCQYKLPSLNKDTFQKIELGLIYQEYFFLSLMISIKVLKSCQLLLPLLFISLSNIYVIIFMIVHSTTSCSFHLKILQFLIGIIFVQLCCELKSKEVSQSFKRVVTKKDNIQTHGGMSQASADGEQIRVVKRQKKIIFMLLMGQTMNTCDYSLVPTQTLLVTPNQIYDCWQQKRSALHHNFGCVM